MVADVADELRLNTGQERSGVLYALVTLTQKLGSSLAVTIIYPILDAVGFVARPVGGVASAGRPAASGTWRQRWPQLAQRSSRPAGSARAASSTR